MFDACLNGFVNFQLAFKQQTQQALNAQSAVDGESTQSNTVSDYQRQFFDLSLYKNRSKNVLTAGGFRTSQVKYHNNEELNKSSRKSRLEAELSDVEIVVERESPKVESVPFPHWMINRQVY
jgi:hypothetical protein